MGLPRNVTVRFDSGHHPGVTGFQSAGSRGHKCQRTVALAARIVATPNRVKNRFVKIMVLSRWGARDLAIGSQRLAGVILYLA